MSYLRGRLGKQVDVSVINYTSSLPFDWRLYPYDIAGSIAHARMLAKQGLISQAEGEKIVQGLEAIKKEISDGKFNFKPESEDIHMAIEERLVELIGEVGGRLHTARSRNDQIALDLRLYLREAISDTINALRGLESNLVGQAERNFGVVMPGYTHLQHAQPVLFSHHMLAYFEMLERDIARLNDSLERVDVMPLGSGALAGVTYNVDREFVARELGFSRVSANSIDAVSDRDFVIEYEVDACLCMMHLSRLAEEVVLWSSSEFDFIEIADEFATTSSIMPQKKNPDVAELARGKTGRVYGHLMAILTLMKALPLSYNRDLQEDKEGLFDVVDTLISTLDILSSTIGTMKVKKESMACRASEGYMLATDLADYLVKRGETFRHAYNIVGRLVNYALERGLSLEKLSLDEYHQFSPLFDQDVYEITLESALAARKCYGGTSPERVQEAIARARRLLDN